MAVIKNPQSIEEIPEYLTPKQKSSFFDVYWKAWSTNGFGTLTKKDSELLIFGCLKKVLGSDGPKNNYEWATLLRLTPSKIKSMRLESHLRFGHLLNENSADSAKGFLDHFTYVQAIDITGLDSKGDLLAVTVSFVIEDPVVQMEIENKLKNLGSYLDFHRNREVVKVRLVDFFKLTADGKEQQAIDHWVITTAKAKADAKTIRSRVSASGYAQMTEAEKILEFVDDLAELGKVKVLTEHLKRIFRSQKEK
jgi:hypothetical protein